MKKRVESAPRVHKCIIPRYHRLTESTLFKGTFVYRWRQAQTPPLSNLRRRATMASRKKRTAMEIKREQKQRRLRRQRSKAMSQGNGPSSAAALSSFRPVSSSAASSDVPPSAPRNFTGIHRSLSCPPHSASAPDELVDSGGRRDAPPGGFIKPLPFAKFRPEKFSVIGSSKPLSSSGLRSASIPQSHMADFLSPTSNFRPTANLSADRNYTSEKQGAVWIAEFHRYAEKRVIRQWRFGQPEQQQEQELRSQLKYKFRCYHAARRTASGGRRLPGR